MAGVTFGLSYAAGVAATAYIGKKVYDRSATANEANAQAAGQALQAEQTTTTTSRGWFPSLPKFMRSADPHPDLAELERADSPKEFDQDDVAALEARIRAAEAAKKRGPGK